MVVGVLAFGFLTLALEINAEFLDSYWTKMNTVSSFAIKQTFKLYSANREICLLKCHEKTGCHTVVMETKTDNCYGYSDASNITTISTGFGDLYCSKERCDDNGYTCLMPLNLCYKLHTKAMNWMDAKHSCEIEGATLFIVETLQQLQLLTEIAATVVDEQIFWVGADDKETEGSWIWLNGKPLSSLFWRPGDPNGNAIVDEDCIGFLDTGLVDVTCTNSYYYFCQKKA